MEINETHTEHEHATTSLKVVLLVFAIVLVGALAYLVWAQNTAPDTTDNSAVVTKKSTAGTPPTTSTTPSTTKTDSTDSWKTYTNSDYGFTLTFWDLWRGYKVKQLTGDSTTLVGYSFTTPFAGEQASYINDAGYTNLFIVSVRTIAQYNAIENKGILLGRNSANVFTYQTTQESVESRKALENDIKTVVATFSFTN